MADTDVAPATDKDSTSYRAADQNPKAGTSHLTQGVNTDDLPLRNGVPVQPGDEDNS